MTREEARTLTVDYLYGELSREEAVEFETAMDKDPELRAEVESFMDVRRATASLGEVHLPAEVRRRLVRAAGRYAGEQHSTQTEFMSFIERFFLSPAFSSGLVVLVALGVGVHLIMETGVDDRITRLERAETAAVSEIARAAPAAAPEEEAVFDERPDEDKAGGESRTDAVLEAQIKGRAMGGGGRASMVVAKVDEPTVERKEASAPVPAAKPRMKKVAESDRYEEAEHVVLLDEARRLGNTGERDASLAAYMRAISEGLSKEALKDALYEAAEVARLLGKTEVARALLERLSGLPGGMKRAKRALKMLED